MTLDDLRSVVEQLDALEISASEFYMKGIDTKTISFTVSCLMEADVLSRATTWNVAVVPHPSPSVKLGTEGKIRVRAIL